MGYKFNPFTSKFDQIWMDPSIYDPSNIEKDLFSVSNLVYTDSNIGSDTTGNGSIKAPFATIQFAIDSITTNAIDNRFQIIAYPWLYEENIIMKGYVDLWWPWVIVRWTSWTLITLTDNISIVERVRFELIPTTSGNSIMSCSTSSGSHELNFCEFDITSSTNWITSSIANVSNGTILITDSLENYTMTWTSPIQNTHKIFNVTWDGSFNLFRNTIITSIDDENDIIYEVYEESTWLLIVVDVLSSCFINNVAYSGSTNIFGFFGTWVWNKRIFQNVMEITGAGTGTWKIIEVDSSSDNLTVESYFNRFVCAWFLNNYNTDIATWDIVESFYNRIDAVDGDVWAGSITKLQTESWELRVNTAIIDETLLLGTPTNESLQKLFNISFNAGFVAGWVITDNWDGTIDVSSGTGLIRIADANDAQIQSFDWVETASISLVDGSNNIVFIDYNGWSPIVTSSTDRDIVLNNEHDKFELVEIVREWTELHISDHRQTAVDVWDEIQRRLYSINPVERADNSGLILWETGTRNVTVTAGKIWRKLIPEFVDAIDTNVSDSFDRYYQDWIWGWTKQSAQTQWDNLQYDDGTGILATMTNNRYSFQDFYLNWEWNLVSLYGQNQFVSLAAAEEAWASSGVPVRLESNSILIWRIVFRKLDIVAQDILSSFSINFNSTAVADHGNLSGLWDDDHTQYLLVNGTRAMTGNLDLGTSKLVWEGGTEGIYIDSAGQVGIGTDAPASQIHVSDPTEATFQIQTDSGKSKMFINNDVASPAADTELGRVTFRGKNTAGTGFQYARFAGWVEDSTAGNEKGYMTIDVQDGGISEAVRIDKDGMSLSGTLDVGFNDVTNDYNGLNLKHDTNSGGGYTVEKESGLGRFIGLAGFDSGANNAQLFFGGGGWGTRDVNKHRFYTDPTTANASTDGGLLRMTIMENGTVNIGAQTTQLAQLHVDQASTTAALPVLTLDQADISEEMISFETTIGTGNPIEAKGAKTFTETHFIKVTLPGGLTRYIPAGTIS